MADTGHMRLPAEPTAKSSRAAFFAVQSLSFTPRCVLSRGLYSRRSESDDRCRTRGGAQEELMPAVGINSKKRQLRVLGILRRVAAADRLLIATFSGASWAVSRTQDAPSPNRTSGPLDVD